MKHRTRDFFPMIVVAVAIGLSSCASSGTVKSEIEASIPDTAFEIHLYSDQSPEDYLGYIRRRLEMKGFTVLRYSAVDQNMATTSADIGRRLTLAIYVTVSYDVNVSKTLAVFSGIQGRDEGFVGAARWNPIKDDQAYAFGSLAEVVSEFDYEDLVYIVEM